MRGGPPGSGRTRCPTRSSKDRRSVRNLPGQQEARHLSCCAMQPHSFSLYLHCTLLSPVHCACTMSAGLQCCLGVMALVTLPGLGRSRPIIPHGKFFALRCRVSVDAHLVVPLGAFPFPLHSPQLGVAVERLPRLFHSGGPEGVNVLCFWSQVHSHLEVRLHFQLVDAWLSLLVRW